MKRVLFLLMAALLLAACSEDEPTEEVAVTEESDEIKVETKDTEHTTETEINFYEDKHMVVAGSTDLPDGEEVIISVTSEENEYTAVDTQEVKDGIYASEVFTKQGEDLPSGEYKITIESVNGDTLHHEEKITIE